MLEMDHSSTRNFFGLLGRRQQQEEQQATTNCIHESHNDARHSYRRGSRGSSFDDYTFDDANNFPTRATDLRHVDQSINLMDVETANYRAPPSDYVFRIDDDEDDSYYDGSEDDVYNNYTQGYRAANAPPKAGRRGSSSMIELKVIQDGLNALREGRLPRRYSEPDLLDHEAGEGVIESRRREPKHHSMSFLTDLDDSSDRFKSMEDSSTWGDILLATHRRKHWWRRLHWALVGFLLVVAVVLTAVVWEDLPVSYATNGGNVNAETTAPPVSSSTELVQDDTPPPAAVPSTAPGAIARRRLVLKHVLEKGLLHQNHDHAKALDLSHSTGQKGLTWMTATDEVSMKLLDDYHFYHHEHTLHPEPIVSGKHYTPTNKEEMDQDRKILDRYVYVVYYFVEHPESNPKNCKIH